MGGRIVVEGLGKQFTRFDQPRARTLKERMLRGFREPRAKGSFWALRDVGFTVESGAMLGVIGHNGSGKSTLLRLLGGVMQPDAGRVITHGRVNGLLELNTGMHSELTGRENVLIGGVVAGLTKRQVLDRFDDIVAFAELERFIDSPIRTYSTGMMMRLGFAVSIHTDPQVLLIDEVLSVGDLAFQNKCLDRIRGLREQGCAIVLISHDLSQIEELCDQALWLRGGSVVAHGTPDILVGEYKAEMANRTRARTPVEMPEVVTPSGVVLKPHENRFGSLEMQITAVRLLDPTGRDVRTIESGEPLTIEIGFTGDPALPPPIVGVSIADADYVNCVDVNTEGDRAPIDSIQPANRIALQIRRLDLSAGHYHVNVGLYHPSWAYAYDYHWEAYPLTIEATVRTSGRLAPPRSWLLGDG